MNKNDAMHLIGRAGMMQAEILPELLISAPVGSRWEKVYEHLEAVRDEISAIIVEHDELRKGNDST